MNDKILNRDDILGVVDIVIEKVHVPEWLDGFIFVKGLTGSERDKFEASIIERRGKHQQVDMANVRAKLASLTICDEAGKRLFAEKDAKALGEKSAAALQRVFEVAQRLSRIGDDDIDELVEGLKKDPFDDSPID